MEQTSRKLQPGMKSVTLLSPRFVTGDKRVTVTCHPPLYRAVTVTTERAQGGVAKNGRHQARE
jgi:hypothetical protein